MVTLQIAKTTNENKFHSKVNLNRVYITYLINRSLLLMCKVRTAEIVTRIDLMQYLVNHLPTNKKESLTLFQVLAISSVQGKILS